MSSFVVAALTHGAVVNAIEPSKASQKGCVVDFDVGSRLKELRNAAGYTQRELAGRAGVPHGLISVIEQNRSSPSVSSLRKIIGGLNLTLAEFFKEAKPNGQQIFFKKEELSDLTSLMPLGTAATPPIHIVQVGDAKVANLQVLYERYETGADTGETMFQHEAHEGGYVIAGTLELTVGDRVGLLGPGDGFLFDSRTPHRYRNAGHGVLELVVANTPPFL